MSTSVCILLRHADDCEIGEHCETIPTGNSPGGIIIYNDMRWQFRKLHGFEYWERVE